ncbi:hypothetical protein [Nocardia arizonensis]|uniref:hypothetical protein n=1 Tax=Nocardia arizonensis TaxID=1141647 RepID=UPI0006D099A7|nr:hypothetical protein [Nocardia arizonensis]
MAGSDEQLDLGFAVEQTEWGKWVDPERRAAQVWKFMKHAGLQEIPAEPWALDAPEVKRLNPIVAELFPDMATAMAPENADMADAFICFMGECFVKYAGAEWIDEEYFGREYSFYDHVNPALLFDNHDEDVETAYGLMQSIITRSSGHDGMFSKLVAILREYREYYEEKRREDASM